MKSFGTVMTFASFIGVRMVFVCRSIIRKSFIPYENKIYFAEKSYENKIYFAEISYSCNNCI